MESQVVPIEIKEDWIRGVMQSGVDIIQVGSFVHPVKVPQMADTDELIRRLAGNKSPAVTIAGLALNDLNAG
jgi:hydroxymethylglutaryl-CoA lyase